MESNSEKIGKNDGPGEPSDAVMKEDTEKIEQVFQPECHPVEELHDISSSPSSSNNQTIEDIDINDIVLITEPTPVIECSVENNMSIEPNAAITNHEAQAVNDDENVNIDNIQSIEGMGNETSQEQPMDIDEILNSLEDDFDTQPISEAHCEPSPQIAAETSSELSNIEKEKVEKEKKVEEEIVLLSDDEEDENEKVMPEPELSAKTIEVEESSRSELELLSTDNLNIVGETAVKSDEKQCDASLPIPVTADVSATETPIIRSQDEQNDIVMLSDDENEPETRTESSETITAVEEIASEPNQNLNLAGPSEITKPAENDATNVENQESSEQMAIEETVDANESNNKLKIHSVQAEHMTAAPINEFTDDLLLENDDLFAKADEVNDREVQKIDNIEKCVLDVGDISIEKERVVEELDIQTVEKAESIASVQTVDDAKTSVLDAESPLEKLDDKPDTQISKEAAPKNDNNSEFVSDAEISNENDKADDELDIQIIEDADSETTIQKFDDNEPAVSNATFRLEIEKEAEESTDQIMDDANDNGANANEAESPMEVDLTQPKHPITLRKECINCECPRKSDVFYPASEFIINHFHLKKRPKLAHVCEPCHDSVTEHYAELCAALEDKQPLFYKMPKKSDIEVISSSDEEDNTDSKSDENDESAFDANTLAMIENELETIITDTLRRVDIDQQMNWNHQLLKTKIESNEKYCIEMMREAKSLHTNFDNLIKKTYNIRHNFVEELQSLDVKTMRPTQICNESYPPTGELKYPDIAYNTYYYTFRKRQISRWLLCKVIDMVPVDGKFEYSIRICHDIKQIPTKNGVLRKHLAHSYASDYRLNIGTRVIARFIDNESKLKDKCTKNNFYPGVIAEPLSLYTRWRYLIFFDHGHSQYVYHESVRIVCEPVENVWELIEDSGAKAFVEGYMRQLKKKRPVVQVQRGQKIQTEYCGKWYNGIVNNVDASLVQIFFEEHKRYDWIYRGSTRFLPLYKKLKHVTQPKNSNDTVIEYIIIDDDKEPERSTEPPVEEIPQNATPPTPSQPSTEETQPAKSTPMQRTFASQAVRDTPQQKQREQKRAVAKKSTSTQPKPTIQHMNNSTIYVDEDNPKGKVVYYTAKKHIDVRKYIHHECQPSCLIVVKHNLATYSPLSKPLLSGFERQICKTRFNKKFVLYRAPCGRRLRDMDEMHRYLRITNCELNVDNFTFDPLIHCLAEYVIESYVLKKADLSGGIEKMPVQMVNQYDTTQPPPCEYSAKRIPTEGVDLTLNPEFMCGCDCTDDCADKSKCACWQLTLQGAKYGNPEIPIENVGYSYKLLNDPVPTGIYECNSQCKCKSNCMNRVVQHPLQLKLQIFKTVNRGWGLRCLNDVPKGSFICCYAGNLLTETAANDAGEDLGDEYFAELDYIEVVENMKEGYEPDVVNDENESSGTDEDFDIEKERSRNNDSDDEFVADKRYTTSEDSESRRYRTRNSVDTLKKSIQMPKPKEVERRKERSSSSDEDGDGMTHVVKNFMVSTTMPLTNEPDEEKGKSIRKLYGKNEAVYIMDAKKAGNIGRYFNHSCGPNLFVQNVFVDTHDLRFPWVAFFASTHIRAGTELTWNYNYEVGSVPHKVLICQCGDVKCRGRIL